MFWEYFKEKVLLATEKIWLVKEGQMVPTDMMVG